MSYSWPVAKPTKRRIDGDGSSNESNGAGPAADDAAAKGATAKKDTGGSAKGSAAKGSAAS